jgi:hypothetical protein
MVKDMIPPLLIAFDSDSYAHRIIPFMHAIKSERLMLFLFNTKFKYLKSFMGQTVYPIENPFSLLN